VGRFILVVVAVLIGLLYSAYFVAWNATNKVVIITWNAWMLGMETPRWIPEVPVGMLPILGAAIGGFAVALGAWLPWMSQRRTSKTADLKLRKAIAKFQEQKALAQERDERIVELESEIEQLRADAAEEPAEAEDLEEGPEPVAAPVEPQEHDEEAEPEEEAVI